MKVYSDILTRKDLAAALPPRVHLWIVEEMPRPRKRARAWEVSLSGTSPYQSQLRDENGSHYAATYDEHGEWMAELFAIDPDAHISWWKGADDFHARTEHKYAIKERKRLEELRTELRAERISYGELAELQGLAAFIDPGDVELLEAAGVPEFPRR